MDLLNPVSVLLGFLRTLFGRDPGAALAFDTRLQLLDQAEMVVLAIAKGRDVFLKPENVGVIVERDEVVRLRKTLGLFVAGNEDEIVGMLDIVAVRDRDDLIDGLRFRRADERGKIITLEKGLHVLEAFFQQIADFFET